LHGFKRIIGSVSSNGLRYQLIIDVIDGTGGTFSPRAGYVVSYLIYSNLEIIGIRPHVQTLLVNP
jgi:uncharacterized protein (DUF779 family)